MKIIKYITILLMTLTFNVNAQTECGFEIKLEEPLEEQMFYDVSLFDNAPPRRIQNRIISITDNEIVIGLRNEELGRLKCNYQITGAKLKLRFGVESILQNDGSIITEVAETPKYQEVAINIKNLKSRIEKVSLNGEEIRLNKSKFKLYPIEYELLEGDTINRKNKYGEKTGIWIVQNDEYGYKQIEESYYDNSDIIWKKIKEFYRNGQLREVNYFKDKITPEDTIGYESFYPSGKILEKKIVKKAFSKGDRYRIIYYENGKVNQDFIYNGSTIKLVGYYENGTKKYEGETSVGVEKFNKGPIICYNSHLTKVECKFWKENGDLQENRTIEFLTNDLTNIEERKRRRTMYSRQ